MKDNLSVYESSIINSNINTKLSVILEHHTNFEKYKLMSYEPRAMCQMIKCHKKYVTKNNAPGKSIPMQEP